MKRVVVTLLAVALVAGACYFALSRYLVSRLDGTGGAVAPPGSGLEVYHSGALGVSFSYPFARYDIQAPAPDTLVLLPEGYVPPQGGEGPPAITVTMFNDAEGLPLEQFIQNEPKTNYPLSPDKTLTQTTLGGLPAVAYTYTGLYESDAAAVKVGSRVYVFAAAWADAGDQIRQDFKSLLQTVTFTHDAN
jgi:hypothetical protein